MADSCFLFRLVVSFLEDDVVLGTRAGSDGGSSWTTIVSITSSSPQTRSQGALFPLRTSRWAHFDNLFVSLHTRPLDFKPSPHLPFYQIRDVTDRSKQHCFELFCSGNEVIKACKTDSDGKVCILMFFYSKCSIFGLTCDDIDIIWFNKGEWKSLSSEIEFVWWPQKRFIWMETEWRSAQTVCQMLIFWNPRLPQDLDEL